MSEPRREKVQQGEGRSAANLADLGEGPGFRKIRGALGVTAFGVNAIVLPPSYSTNLHFHDEQEELYFVHSGRIAIEFGDGSEAALGPGGHACVDGKDGYVGRDGQLAPGETHRH